MNAIICLRDFQQEENKVASKINILAKPLLYFFIRKVSNFLKLLHMRTMYFRSMNRNLKKMESCARALAKSSKKANEKDINIHDDLLVIIDKFQGVYNRAEKIKFNGNSKSQELFISILDYLYSAERNYRRSVYQNRPAIDDSSAISLIRSVTTNAFEKISANEI